MRVPLESDAGPVRLHRARSMRSSTPALGRPFANNSPAELGARTVEILEAAYRSAASGAAERVKTLA